MKKIAMYYVSVTDNINRNGTSVLQFMDLESAKAYFLRLKEQFLDEIERCGVEVTVIDDSPYEYNCSDGEDDFSLIISKSIVG